MSSEPHAEGYVREYKQYYPESGETSKIESMINTTSNFGLNKEREEEEKKTQGPQTAHARFPTFNPSVQNPADLSSGFDTTHRSGLT